jgi:hypothetical protein
MPTMTQSSLTSKHMCCTFLSSIYGLRILTLLLSNASSLSVVEESYNDADGDNKGVELSSRDDALDIQIIEGQEVALKWLKCCLL